MTASRGQTGDSREPVARGHLRIVRATRASDLAADLAAQFAPGAAPELWKECLVVVQGPGMAQWVRADMVRRLGAWGGMDTPFLREFLLGLPARADLCEGVPRGRQPLQELGYRIAACVVETGKAADSPFARAIEPLMRMCRDASGALQLDAAITHGHALAEAFDRYEVDRPELIEAWRSGRAWKDGSSSWDARAAATETWQRALWSKVVPAGWKPHAAWCALRGLIRRFESGEVPGRIAELGLVSVFGVSSLPPLALHVLRALARHVPVHVHMLVPTLAFQSRDDAPRAQVARALAQGVDTASLPEGGPRRHPLLASLGGAAVAAATVVDGIEAEVIDLEPDASGDSMLRSIQTALCLDEAPVEHACTHDDSVRVHGVSSATRMAEIVHDEILHGFTDLPGLRQEEVLVLAPGLDALAGTLQGVVREREALHAGAAAMSLRVADAAGADRAQIATAIARLLDLASEDQPMDRVRALLQSAPCCARAEVESSRMESLLDAMEEAGARRFLDAATRARWLGGAHADDALHTLEWSIDRLVLGSAAGASPASQILHGEVLPSGTMAALESDVMHRALRLLDAVGDLARMVQRGDHAMVAWHAALAQACETILPGAEHEAFGRQRDQADRAIAQVADAATAAGLGAVPWPVARAEFESALRGLVEGRSFAAGGITLARLTPMRSVPARLLVVAGLDHGVFPRASRRDPLDLSKLCPRAGDRDDRLEDQLLLLESLHAATERLVVVVQDTVATSGQPAPLSPVVEELLGTMAAHAGIDPRTARASLLTHQPTLGDQPEVWSETGSGGFSVHARARAQSIATARREAAERVFASFPHGVPEVKASAIRSMDDMATVLRNPARAWLKGQGIRVADLSHELGERCEPIELDGLQRWHLEQRARRGVLLGEDPESILQTLRQDGSLPHGAVGGPMWREVWSTQQEILTRLIEALGVPACTLEIEPLAFEVPDLDPALEVRTLWIPSHRTQVLVTRVGREKEWLTAWPEHLAFAAAHPDGRTIRIDLPRNRRDAAKSIPHDPVDSAAAKQILRQVREIAAEAQRRLLPIHAELLYPFRGAIDAASEERSESLRQKLWIAGPGFTAPAEDPWFRAAWRGLDLLKVGREPGAPRVAGVEPSFDGIASWLHEAMDLTGWKIRKRKKST